MVEDFYIYHSIEEITKEEVIKVFKKVNIRTENGYTLLHLAIVRGFWEEWYDKCLGLIEILLELGVNPNAKEKNANYTFILLDFYSSYDLEFFEKLIPLVVKYNFNINSKDIDGDTILHSAIFSDRYFGYIFSLFKIVGNDFKFLAVNKLKQNLLTASKVTLEKAKNEGTFLGIYLSNDVEKIEAFMNSKIEEDKMLKKKRKSTESKQKLIVKTDIDVVDNIEGLEKEYQKILKK